MFKNMFPGKKNTKYASITTREANENSGIPEGIVVKCKKCSKVILKKDLERNISVCLSCDYHFSLPAYARVSFLLDENTFVELDENMISTNPLAFPDYESKLISDKEKSGLNEAIVTGHGKINGQRLTVGVMDPSFRMGSMGSVVGEKITKAIEYSIKEKIPFVLFSASGGARMQEGVLSLMQMAKTSAALDKLHKENLLFISYLTNPTTGGVSASFASLGDINLAEPEALIGFAGRRIIEQTIRQKLPSDFQTAEFLLEHGQIDKIVHRKDMKTTVSKLIQMHSISEVKQ